MKGENMGNPYLLCIETEQKQNIPMHCITVSITYHDILQTRKEKHGIFWNKLGIYGRQSGTNVTKIQ